MRGSAKRDPQPSLNGIPFNQLWVNKWFGGFSMPWQP